MSAARRDRLEAHLATLGCPPAEAVKRRVANWPLYAALTSSTMALPANASVAHLITPVDDSNLPVVERALASSGDEPLIRAVKLAMARRNFGSALKGVVPQVLNAAQSSAPGIGNGGIVPLYGTVNIIQPGSWLTIYGTNLASGTAVWNSDFPTSLGGTSVTINGKAAYLSFVSPGQINAQAPDDTSWGPVVVVVTSGAGAATSIVTLNPYSPTFLLRDASHVAGIILRTDGSGAYGNGAYDILGPTGNCFGYPTVAAKPGDVVELFADGFGPTTPAVPAGQPFSGAAPTNLPVGLFINQTPIQPSFVGISSAGLYQINLIVPPGLGEGDVPIQGFVNDMGTQQNLFFSLESGSLGLESGSLGVTQAQECVFPGGDGGVVSGDGGVGGDGGTGVGDGGGGGDGGVGGDGGGGGDGGDGGDGC